MAAPIGNNFNPAGRPKGTPNKTTMIVRELFARILEEEQDNFREALEHLRVNQPKEYVQVITKLSQRFLPEMTRSEITGLDGEPLSPVNIILPSAEKTEKPKGDE
jgi:hypothetical protein